IIPNGIDLDHFNPKVPPIKRFKDGKINILFVGRMERRKGLDYLIKAFEMIRKKNDNVRLIVVGPGKVLRRSYERTVRKRGIEDVVFVGRVTYDELPMYYQTADIYCSPATGGESFGIVLLEAMALGKPIVASRIEGYRHVVTDGQEGILVPPKNSQSLAAALQKLIDDDNLRHQMGSNGITTAARYDWKIIARRVLQFYQETISRCRPQPDNQKSNSES
ncbi:MAG: glycosyltransferase family 4 protein, partial [Dehalococcoidales bacterium]|nr:glycosyltransferase family 4 protein [Dehalococcoidales bacterium]